TERSRDYQRLCEGIVDRINGRFGGPHGAAVTLVYPGARDGSRNCVVAALGMSSATLVNPTFDGLNLVAKEATFLTNDAPLLLSVNAGVHEQLAPYVVDVHPFDVEMTREALTAAVDRAPALVDASTADCHRLLRSEDAAQWLEALAPGS